MTPKDVRELTELVRPVSKWLNDHGTPHSIIIIEQDRFDFYDGKCGEGFNHE